MSVDSGMPGREAGYARAAAGVRRGQVGEWLDSWLAGSLRAKRASTCPRLPCHSPFHATDQSTPSMISRSTATWSRSTFRPAGESATHVVRRPS